MSKQQIYQQHLTTELRETAAGYRLPRNETGILDQIENVVSTVLNANTGFERTAMLKRINAENFGNIGDKARFLITMTAMEAITHVSQVGINLMTISINSSAKETCHRKLEQWCRPSPFHATQTAVEAPTSDSLPNSKSEMPWSEIGRRKMMVSGLVTSILHMNLPFEPTTILKRVAQEFEFIDEHERFIITMTAMKAIARTAEFVKSLLNDPKNYCNRNKLEQWCIGLIANSSTNKPPAPQRNVIANGARPETVAIVDDPAAHREVEPTPTVSQASSSSVTNDRPVIRGQHAYMRSASDDIKRKKANAYEKTTGYDTDEILDCRTPSDHELYEDDRENAGEGGGRGRRSQKLKGVADANTARQAAKKTNGPYARQPVRYPLETSTRSNQPRHPTLKSNNQTNY